ncbi:hypothetical protein DFA_00011 [Cavenderia fasciculata]|uniref:Uncharacterized protein n=1 Tax=Cavenderia fasciculata TaxID=261658 RepID=F4PXC4_CACFS|nr:uncharacterized protein DFA_00011 [Cavenderia fasciculata]EGG19434.1 hypothetical protein DFA_00011 [Cavenderia fasciculata]|eukprot:XP_004357728.1 hypothetical protein DFA_00011 [Cavenderia fasciculata]
MSEDLQWIKNKKNNDTSNTNNNNGSNNKVYYRQSRLYEQSDYQIPINNDDTSKNTLPTTSTFAVNHTNVNDYPSIEEYDQQHVTDTTVSKQQKQQHPPSPSPFATPNHTFKSFTFDDKPSSVTAEGNYSDRYHQHPPPPPPLTPTASKNDFKSKIFEWSTTSTPNSQTNVFSTPSKQQQQQPSSPYSTKNEMLRSLLNTPTSNSKIEKVETSNIWEEYERKKREQTPQTPPYYAAATNDPHQQTTRQMFVGQMLMGTPAPTPPPKPQLKAPFRFQRQDDEPIEDVDFSSIKKNQPNNNQNNNHNIKLCHHHHQQQQQQPIQQQQQESKQQSYEKKRKEWSSSNFEDENLQVDEIVEDTVPPPISSNLNRSSIAETTKNQTATTPTKSHQLKLVRSSSSSLSSYSNLKRNNSFQKDRESFGGLLKDHVNNNSGGGGGTHHSKSINPSQQFNITSSQQSIQSQISSTTSHKSAFVKSSSNLIIHDEQEDQYGDDNDIISSTIIPPPPPNISQPLKQTSPIIETTINSPSQNFNIRTHIESFYKDLQPEEIQSSQPPSSEEMTNDAQLSPTPPKVELFYNREKFLTLESMKKMKQENYEEIDEANNEDHDDDLFENRNLFETFKKSEAEDGTNFSRQQPSSSLQQRTGDTQNFKSMLVNATPMDHSSKKAAPSSKSMNRYEKLGGLSGRLSTLLKKQNFNCDWISQRSVMPTQIPPTSNNIYNHTILELKSHFALELNIVVAELPSLIQPHVFVTTCRVISNVGGASENDDSHLLPADDSLITVIFNMQQKDDWEIQVGTHICLEYWHMFHSTTKSKPTILCLTGKLLTKADQLEEDLLDVVQEQFDIISIKDEKNENILNNHLSSDPSLKEEQQETKNIFEEYIFSDLARVHQNLLDIHLSVIILRFDRLKKKQTNQEYIRIIVKNNGTIGEIQIPLTLDKQLDKWIHLVECGQNPPFQCFFMGLTFLQCKRIECSSPEGSIILSHIQPTLRPPSKTFSLVVLQANSDTRFIVKERSNQAQDSLLYCSPIQHVYSVPSLLNSDIKSMVGQRISIQGTISHIHPSQFTNTPINQQANTLFSTLTLFLYDNNHQQQLSINSLSITLCKQFCETYYYRNKQNSPLQKQQPQQPSLFVIGQTILFRDVFLLPPSSTRSYPLLLTDIYTSVGPVYHQENVDLDLSATQSIPIDDFVTLVENDGLEMMSSYQCLVSAQRAEIIEITKEFIYRGCTNCFASVRPYPNRATICMGYSKEPFFCPKCRILVDSSLMAELNLLIKLSNGFQVVVKIGHPYSAQLFPGPITYQNRLECEDYINNINNHPCRSLINIHGGILYSLFNNQIIDDVQDKFIDRFEIETISTPDIFTLNE